LRRRAATRLSQRGRAHLLDEADEEAAGFLVGRQVGGMFEPDDLFQRRLQLRHPGLDDGRRRLVATVLIGVVAVCALGAALYGMSAIRGRTAATPAVVRPNTSLELIALRTERSADSLTVAGTLHNPATSATQHGLVATVFAFDAAGQLLTSAQAPIDYQELASGDDSPFVVKVAGAHSAARVRVSFRQNGNVVPHIDRRQR